MLSPNDWFALKMTLQVALCATAIALVFGVACGWLLAKTRFAGKHILDGLLLLPMVLPPTVLGYYLLVVFGQQGWLGQWLLTTWNIRLVFTWQGAVLAASIVAFPLVYKSAKAAFEEVPVVLENAARTMGCREGMVFLRVTLPLAMRGITAGGLLAFARAMGEFGATLMIAGNIPGRTQTLSIAIYDAVQAGDDARANTLVVLISMVCVLILAVCGYYLAPKQRAHR